MNKRSYQLGPILLISVALGLTCIEIPREESRALTAKRHSWAVSAELDIGATRNADARSREFILQNYGKLALAFEANRGQTDPQVKFLSRGGGYTVFLTPGEAVLTLHRSAAPAASQVVNRAKAVPNTAQSGGVLSASPVVLRMKLLGRNQRPQVEGLDELPAKSNYFIGNVAQKWLTQVPNFRKVVYRQIYPGVDLVFHGSQRQVEFDFVVAPGSDPEAIQLRFDGTHKLELDAYGDLILYPTGYGAQHMPGQVRLHKPRIYQDVDGAHKEVSGNYVLKSNREVAFEVAPYDASRPLIIDPVLSYSTYLGGSTDDLGLDISTDSAGNAYICGDTNSIDFPTVNPLDASFGGGTFDAFVAKLNVISNALIYSTYLGGTDADVGTGIAIDSSGNAYIAGGTDSTNFPTVNPFQGLNRGLGDSFVAKLNPTGNVLLYSTFLGGSGHEAGARIALDAAGNAHLTSQTSSLDFPVTAGVFQSSLRGIFDNFVTKLNPGGNVLVYSTYLGGSAFDTPGAIAVDSTGNAYIAGITQSSDYPTASAVQPSFGGISDAFVTKLNPFGSVPIFSTYLGGSNDDSAVGITVDASGSAYVSGGTGSANFPVTAGALQTVFGGGSCGPHPCSDGFVSKLGATGTLVYSTYLGGSSEDAARAIVVDSSGNAYLTGGTNSTNFPTANATQPAFAGGTCGAVACQDAFVTKLNSEGKALVYSTYLGGTDQDGGLSIAVDAFRNVYIAGFTLSTNFPTVSPLQSNLRGSRDVFLTKISTPADLAVSGIDSPDPITPGTNLTYTLMVTNNGPDPATDATLADALPAGLNFVSATPTQGTCTGTSTVTCNLGTLANGASATVTIVISPTASGTINNTASVRGNESDPDTTNNSATITTKVTDFGVSTSPSSATVRAGQSATYAVTVSPQGGPFNSAVSLSCSGLPTLASCSFSPSSVNPGGSPATSTLTISTTAPTVCLLHSIGGHYEIAFAFWLPLPGFGVIGAVLLARKRRNRGLRLHLFFCFLLAIVLMQLGCGGGGTGGSTCTPRQGTNPGSHNITIMGTAGPIQHSITATLVVQ